MQLMGKSVSRRWRRTRAAVAVASVGVSMAVASGSVAYGGSASGPSSDPGAAVDSAAASVLPPAAPQPAARKRTSTRSSFRVATLNVLGSNHTRGRGGFRSGRKRAVGEAGMIGRLHIGVIGMSEVQPDQYAALGRDLPRYTIWPKGRLGANGYRLQIAWQRKRFRKVATGHTTYTFSGQRIPMPYVRLRDRRSGATFWVISTHNSPGRMEGQRRAATRTEIRVVKRLRRHGHPVLLLGDLNEHAAAYCRIAHATKMRSANGGRFRNGHCHAPSPSQIDWILGTRHDVRFKHYVRDTATRTRGLSDHPLYYAHARVTDRRR